MIRPPPRSPLFPSTPLFRSERRDVERRPAPWRFERGHGWRFERTAGVWSPYYAWWWVDQRVVLAAVPSATVVQYPDRKSTRLNSSHSQISYAVFCLKKKNKN